MKPDTNEWSPVGDRFIDFDFLSFIYRVAPSPIASGHNPDKLTVEQVGEGWRLLSEEEIVFERDVTEGIQIFNRSVNDWSIGQWWGGNQKLRTYRTQKPEGYFLPKKVVKVEGWVNVYEGGVAGAIRSTRELADAVADGLCTRIACKHIVFEVTEGEGL